MLISFENRLLMLKSCKTSQARPERTLYISLSRYLAISVEKIKGIPSIILAHTKGKGISFMENNPKWHGSLAPQGEERECGCEDLQL
jgi:hypothetical protein